VDNVGAKAPPLGGKHIFLQSLHLRAGEDGGAGCFEEFGSVGANVAVTENGATRNEQFGPSFDDVGNRFQVDSPVYLNPKIEFAFGAHTGQCGDFVQRIGDELLATKARIHAHNQDVMDKIENLRERFDGSSGIKYHAGLAAMRRDQMEGAVEMNAGFLVDRDPVGTCFGKLGDE